LNIGASLNGKLLGFSAVNDDGFTLYTQKLHNDGTLPAPQILYRSARNSYGPLLDFEGRYAVIATTERSAYYEHSLMAFDLTAGESLTAQVLQEDEGSVRPIGFAPIAGDSRLLATTNATGFARPVIWDVTTGDRTDIPLTEFEGDRRDSVNENRIRQVLEIEKRAQENYDAALREAQQLPMQAEQESQQILNQARAEAQEEARQIVAKAKSEDEVAGILTEAEAKNRQLEERAMSNSDRAVNYILDRVAGKG
jgi:vacuolar-type H+-ATPase subunit H